VLSAVGTARGGGSKASASRPTDAVFQRNANTPNKRGEKQGVDQTTNISQQVFAHDERGINHSDGLKLQDASRVGRRVTKNLGGEMSYDRALELRSGSIARG
jgi:hypothetical protein